MDKIKPQKGKDYKNLPQKALNTFDTDTWLQSIKYDGNQIFIVKMGRAVYFNTSDWKPFNISVVANELYLLEDDFILVCEYMHDCQGKLGDRRKSAKLTTYRTNYSKGIKNILTDEAKTNIKVFDAIQLVGTRPITNVPAKLRIKYAEEITNSLKYLSTIQVTQVDGKTAREHTKEIRKRGWEGTMVMDPDSFYEIGKRVNHAIKLKGRVTADLLCIDVEPGEGKYEGMIGSLVLVDSEGRKVSCGSGMSDYDRLKDYDYYIGKVVEIFYEQIMETYIQPTFGDEYEGVHIREDKTKEDIN